MTYYLSPVGTASQIDGNGNPLAAGVITTFQAGTTTPFAVYADNAGGGASVSVLLNTQGLPSSPIWFIAGQAIKFVIKDSLGNLIRTLDNLQGINDPAFSNITTPTEWTLFTSTASFISATSFSVVGDQTSTFQVNRRVRTTNTGGTTYSTITASVFSAGSTTVTVANTSGVLDAGLSAVSYGLLAATNPSIPETTTGSALRTSTVLTARATLEVEPAIKPITASVATNALTITLNPCLLNFRSATLTSGTTNARTVAAAISVVVPSTATLGTVSTIQSRLAVIAIDNAGTVELAVVNLAGGTNLDETGVISTTAISAAATSASVVYSTTARSNVPYRVVGYVESTQATAGTWATAPSTIQGAGGQAVSSMASIGYGQVWQVVTRNSGTTYYNTTGKPIMLNLLVGGASGGTVTSVSIAGVDAIGGNAITVGAGVRVASTFIIPPNAAYSYTLTAGNATATELR